MTLPRTVFREPIKELVIERIVNGSYPPGSRVVESQLAQEFGVSQAPVREALRDLAAMRFIETQPYRGARVRAISLEELSEIYPVRAALEEVAGRAAAPLLTNEVVGELEEQVEAMRAAAGRQAVHEQLVHDVRFHELIVQASGNTVLLEVWRSLRIEARTLISDSRGSASYRRSAVAVEVRRALQELAS